MGLLEFCRGRGPSMTLEVSSFGVEEVFFVVVVVLGFCGGFGAPSGLADS